MEHISKEQELQLVVFQLATEEYGLPITKVQEIIRFMPITKLPQTPSFMEGIINLRGRIIPIVDLRKRFGLSGSEYGEDARIIVVDVSGQTIGIIVDVVNEVVLMSGADVEPAPPSFILDAQYIHGVGKLDGRLVILLDIDRALTNQEEIELKHFNG